MANFKASYSSRNKLRKWGDSVVIFASRLKDLTHCPSEGNFILNTQNNFSKTALGCPVNTELQDALIF